MSNLVADIFGLVSLLLNWILIKTLALTLHTSADKHQIQTSSLYFILHVSQVNLQKNEITRIKTNYIYISFEDSWPLSYIYRKYDG